METRKHHEFNFSGNAFKFITFRLKKFEMEFTILLFWYTNFIRAQL